MSSPCVSLRQSLPSLSLASSACRSLSSTCLAHRHFSVSTACIIPSSLIYSFIHVHLFLFLMVIPIVGVSILSLSTTKFPFQSLTRCSCVRYINHDWEHALTDNSSPEAQLLAASQYVTLISGSTPIQPHASFYHSSSEEVICISWHN